MDRRIVAVETTETPVPEGLIYRVFVTLNCGHVRQPNAIYTYRVGDRYNCPVCDEGSN